MKNNTHRKEQGSGRNDLDSPSEGYIFLVRNPASNESGICAWNEMIANGTLVVFETRYGLDLGVVVADASHLRRKYVPGNRNVCGCLCPGMNIGTEKKDNGQPPVADESVQESDTVADEVSVSAPEDEQTVATVQNPTDADVDENEVIFSADEEENSIPTESEQMNRPVKVSIPDDMSWLERIATRDDLNRYRQLSRREDDAMRVCREKIAKHGLNMKLVTAHFLLLEPKVVFFFTADVRVDFRELVKDLVSVFKIRIELRQIGVRDESRVLGGLAVCGRDFCCHGVTDKLSPVSIKMAKEQNLSLNSMKISGPCGRLLCCLAYEQDFYVEEKKNYPPEGSRIKVGHDLMKVSEVNILSHKITLVGPEGRVMYIDGSKTYFNQSANHWMIEKEYLEELLS
ncbi:MAG: hypothetical protein LKE40_10535 [Spirochaetia bacterium]|nr:hypothetical protein [Spirochaetia bacterium]